MQSTVKLTSAQAIVRFLTSQYTSRDGVVQRLVPGILGIFGHGNSGGIGQALDDYRDDFFFIEGRNEQGLGHIAAGYAKTARRESTLAVSTSVGPGSTNLITAAAGAHLNRLPILLFPSDTYMSRLQGPILQGLEHPLSPDMSVNDCFRPVSRFFDRIVRAEQVIDTLPRAMQALTDQADAGPVVISLPQDVQIEPFDYPLALFDTRVWPIERPRPDATSIDTALKVLASAERPIIVAGGGVVYSRAEKELLAFAEKFQIPVAETFAARGTMPRRHRLNLGALGFTGSPSATNAAREADLVIAAGTRLSDCITGSRSIFSNPTVRFIGMNINGADAIKLGATAIVGDLREAILELASKLGSSVDRSQYMTRIEEHQSGWYAIRRRATESLEAPPLRQSEMVEILNSMTQPGDVVVAAAGTLPGDLFALWAGDDDAECHIEFGYSCMGYEIPGGLGARLAKDGGEVYSLVGDATFILNPSEIAVAAQHRLKITVIISNNIGMRSIVGLEKRLVARPYANLFEERDPTTFKLGPQMTFNLAQVAEGLGARTFVADSRESFALAVESARSEDGPCVIVVATDCGRSTVETGVWWDIPVPASSERTDVSRLRAVYEAGRADQRVHL
jgi:3D-(3,5/4)-trihydroxycyclohexane-1,2-dione acylhydrolase (decyclizing)